ncbi:hypothetical protein RJ640_016193 [Escallonia rubra]|uniref:Retrotransposon gag domain-containing protein n=1 Tax=Escallonia rubra TaxID=112253 RepID=A0AA88QLZ5_9ASTE|nr:hypothetical protein RJ640_016193 [Escallonia rubra]
MSLTCSESNISTPTVTMQVLMTGVMSVEEQLAAMSCAIENLTKIIKEKGFQSATFMSRLELQSNEKPNHGEVNEASKKNDTNEIGYQLPKFQQFDGKGNLRQHVAHFIETHEVVRPVNKGNAFDWYTDSEPKSINCYEEMGCEFHNHFYSTDHFVCMMELTNTKQRKEEPAMDYIKRWRALSLDYKERLFEASIMEMCIQGMNWGFLYILQGHKPCTFEDLATRDHNMAITMASHARNNPPIGDSREDTREARWRWGVQKQ